MPPDPQTLLQQPMWTTALQFIHSPHNSSNGNTTNHNSHTNLLASGTAYKHVHIYDIRTSSSSSSNQTRRPILHTPENFLTHRITSLLQLPNTNHLLVADSTGDCHILDLRKFHSGKPSPKKSPDIGIGRLVGPGGSIRQLALHPTLPLVACVGLDRKLWSWDICSKRLVDCIYLRQRLNCLLICEDEGWEDGGVEKKDLEGEKNVVVSESGNWEEETDDVRDYVDSDTEEKMGGGSMEESSSSGEDGSSLDNTQSESNESESSDEEVDPDDDENDLPPSKQLPRSKHGRMNKKQKL